MRVTILGVNFAPERTGIAPYTTGLARHLAEEHDVTVVTGLPHYPDWRVPEDDRCWHREEVDGRLRVIRVGHYVPRHMNAATRALFELTWAAHAGMVARRIPTDLVIAVVPALLGAHAARLVARRFGVPYGLIVQDVMGAAAQQSGVAGGRLVAGLTRNLETSALRAADGVCTIHPRLAHELTRLSGHRTDVVYNWTHVLRTPRAGRAMRRRLGWRDDEVIVLHSGNMGLKQNLEVVVDAARLAQRGNEPVRFVLAGGGSQLAKLQGYARGCTHISFVGSLGDDDYIDFLASADVLLVNERPGMSEMSLPSKLTSYLIAGRPVVAATDAHSGTADFVAASGAGVVTPPGQPQMLLEAVTETAANPATAHALAENGRAFAESHLTAKAAMAGYDQWVADLVNPSSDTVPAGVRHTNR